MTADYPDFRARLKSRQQEPLSRAELRSALRSALKWSACFLVIPAILGAHYAFSGDPVERYGILAALLMIPCWVVPVEIYLAVKLCRAGRVCAFLAEYNAQRFSARALSSIEAGRAKLDEQIKQPLTLREWLRLLVPTEPLGMVTLLFLAMWLMAPRQAHSAFSRFIYWAILTGALQMLTLCYRAALSMNRVKRIQAYSAERKAQAKLGTS